MQFPSRLETFESLSLPIPRQPRPVSGRSGNSLAYLVPFSLPLPSPSPLPPLPSPSALHSTYQSLWRSAWLPSQKQSSSVTLTVTTVLRLVGGEGRGWGGAVTLFASFVVGQDWQQMSLHQIYRTSTSKLLWVAHSTSLPSPVPFAPPPPPQLPKGLCVHLQRVAWEPSQPPCKKEDHVVFPLTLELGACHGW